MMLWANGRRAVHDAYAIHMMSKDPYSIGGTRTRNSTATACSAFEAGKILAVVENLPPVGKGWLKVAYGPEYSLSDFRSVYEYLLDAYKQTPEWESKQPKTQGRLARLLQLRIDDIRFKSRCFFVDSRRDADFDFQSEYSRPLYPINYLCSIIGCDPKNFTATYGQAWDFWKEETDKLDKKYLPPVSAVVEREKEARRVTN